MKHVQQETVFSFCNKSKAEVTRISISGEAKNGYDHEKHDLNLELAYNQEDSWMRLP